MRVPGDLGFRGVSVIFFFVFISISSFVIRRKWRNSVERKREILRLVAMASEEAARAELEAAQEYGTVTVVRQSQCVVCYCPTTTRCSRCKAVRYCSGKCQIIHWRQGHKEECNPPSNNFQFDGPGSDFDRNSACQEPNVSGSTLENDGKVAPSTDVKETYMRSESTSVSSLADFSINTGSESMAGVSISKVPYSSYADRPDGPASDSISREVQYTTDHVKEPEVSPSQPFRSDSSVNDFFCSSTVKQTSFTSTVGVVNTASSKPSTTHSNFWEGTFDSNGYGNDNCDDSTSSSLSEGGDGTLLGSKPSSRFFPSQDLRAISNSRSPSSKVEGHLPSDGNCTNLGNNSSYHGASQSQRITRDTPRLNRSATSSSRRSESLDGVTSDSHLLEPKEKRSLSSTSDNKPPYTSRDHLFSSMRSSVADSVKRVPAGSSEVSYSLLNASKGLKTSARKVAHQFKVYKHSKYNSAGTASESTEKCSYKMLFPYELFVKLYHWNKLELRPCGFTNCGNSCYANAVLQCLAFTRPLTAYLLQGLHSKACRKKDWCFTCEFESLILKAKEGKSPLSPIGILSQLQSIGSHLNHGREEDAHDFLRNAIDTMQSVCLSEAEGDVERPLAEETSLIGLVFGGYLRSKIKCMKCSGKSERQERMMDLTVEIQGDIGTLEEALKKFTATEILDGENKYYCSRCKSYEKAKKKLTVLEAPNVLTIALKRFQSGNFGKLNKAVQFPEILDLAPYMSETNDKSPIYRLYAVVVHLDIMNAAFSGHYVCYVSNMQGKWFMIDDSTVKPVELERVLSKGAYMLFYSRCSPRAPSLIRNTLLSEETKANGYSEATPSAHRSRFSSTIPRAGSYLDSPVTYESFESYDRSFHPLHRIPKVDSASDNSSLLSNSDEGSCSTESTRDSIDDCSEYLFGESGRNCEGSSFSCYSGDIVVEADRVCSSRPFLHPDTNIQCRNLMKSSSSSGYGRSSSSSRETDLERLGWCYPLEGKNGVSQRKSIRDRSTKTLY